MLSASRNSGAGNGRDCGNGYELCCMYRIALTSPKIHKEMAEGVEGNI